LQSVPSKLAECGASGPADPDFILEPNARAIRFGDGQNGRTPPPQAAILCVGQQTAGSAGNVAADAIATLDFGMPNNSRLGDVVTLANRFARIGNRKPAADGADEEPVAHAEGRLALTLQRPSRAVTLDDCKTLALETPGTRVMRAAVFGNLHPAFPCYRAPGFITLVILPALPAGRPMPSPGLLHAVSAYVGRRHIIGTRIEVVGPSYVELGVQAKVVMVRGQSRIAVANAITDALQRFLDPLSGGPDGNGWPLGRDVYVSEILATIARVPGVHHVTSLALLVPGEAPQCGNVCLGPLALTVSGAHQIEVS
jgi:predicted phage baseplate assembly protein